MIERSEQIAVGQSFILPPPQANFDGGVFEWRKSESPLFLLYLGNPTLEEVKGFKSSLEFALNYQNGVIWIFFRTPTMDWSGCPYSLFLLPERDRPIIPQELTPKSRLAVVGVMIDSCDNKVMAIKDFTFEPVFTQRLYELLKRQENSPSAAKELESRVQMIYSDPNAEDQMVSSALAYSKPGL